MTARAVVTGIGVVAPSGVGSDAHWATVSAGIRRTGPITLFDPASYPTRVAGEVADFDPAGFVDARQRVQTDRWSHLGFAATRLALTDAGLADVSPDPYRWAVTLASSSGGNLFGQRELQRLWGGPTRTVGAYQSIAWFYAASVGQLSIRHQFKGPSGVTVSEAAGGLDSLAHAVRTVRRGTPVVIAGATECPLSPYALACQLRSGLLSDVADPQRAYRPFDVSASGYVPAEGGAVFVVEELGHALGRGARVYGEITGWAATHDGAPTDPEQGPDPTHYARALKLALDRAAVRPHDVDVIWPDALGVPAYDRAEASALRAVFGDRPPPVTTQKPLTGRAHQGSSALDAATALLAFSRGVLPVSAGPDEPASGCELTFLREPRPPRSRIALVGARGFDGFNSALVLRGAAPPPAAGS
ncbi:beta-ketoacyl synthase N-terminal-like domain-containing protein [Micromonospora sp. WMMD980]|uniref:beta-ketoacyl synthase N-terminal-like domain-containing protein n=1 Tax=Micromonospora sp. WMMD980 TaxID=3016088 RepID=UPI002417D7A1|nr:beta-ketoacyl synthase N-terminal-like domain-containing protein [Micromonospora sp. WMMD980]MDG4800543.1 beta-ketoacyl synthase N-terminal-like domain-containing protein [Micromonospora sp. WMMD980]